MTMILAHLNRIPGVFAWRQNTGAARLGDRTVRFGLPGQADITGILPNGRRLEVEVKRPGEKPTKLQQIFGERIRRAGGLHVVAHTLDEALGPVREALA